MEQYTNLLTAGGATGILVFMVVGFMKSWIITPGRFQDAVDDKLAYKSAYESERVAREKADQVAQSMLDQMELTVSLLNEIRGQQSSTSRRTGRPT